MNKSNNLDNQLPLIVCEWYAPTEIYSCAAALSLHRNVADARLENTSPSADVSLGAATEDISVGASLLAVLDTLFFTRYRYISVFCIWLGKRAACLEQPKDGAYTGYYSVAAPRETSALGEVVHEPSVCYVLMERERGGGGIVSCDSGPPIEYIK